MKKKIWNIGFNEITPNQLLDELDQQAAHGTHCQSIAFVNPHSQVAARHNPELLKKINDFDYVLCDGIGTELAAKFFTNYKIQRLSGPAFFKQLAQHLNHPNNTVSYFFLGSTENVLNNIKTKMQELYPHIPVTGTYSPPMGNFSDQDNTKIIETINHSNATVLWVGMTAPKQETWIANHSHHLQVKIAAGIGAEFDYFAGTKARPPEWISTAGLQWLHRLFTQPATWQRTVVSAPIFISHVINEWLKIKLSKLKT